MLLSFTVGNFRSFNTKKTLSLVASSIKEHSDFVRTAAKTKVLPSITIYGANSSGKSNLLIGLAEMVNFILESNTANSSKLLTRDSFAFFEGNRDIPTSFDTTFSINDDVFRYGFEYTEEKITKEWLYKKMGKKYSVLFIRNEKGIGVAEEFFPEGKDKEIYTHEKRLFLSVVDQLNGLISKKIMNFFSNLNVISGIYDDKYRRISINLLEKPNQELQKFIQNFDLGFSSLQITEKEINFSDDIPERIKQSIIRRGNKAIESGHYITNDKGIKKEEFFPISTMESEGTKKILNISGPLYDTLTNGKILVIDELDAKLHPLLTKYIINCFNSPSINTQNAQLIFATHDTNLLSNKIMRRDQIWFAEKDSKDDSTDIYPLSEIREQDGTKIRDDRIYEKDYINGKYGAIPFLRF